MQNNSQNFSIPDMKRIAQSQAGKELLSLLKQENSAELEQIANLASSGNISQAKNILQQMLNSSEAHRLIQKLGEENG